MSLWVGIVALVALLCFDYFDRRRARRREAWRERWADAYEPPPPPPRDVEMCAPARLPSFYECERIASLPTREPRSR